MAVLEIESLHNGLYVCGPLAVLSATLWSGVALAIWRKNIGETSCAWRVEYSPNSRAFAIWLVIYIWTFCVLVAELISIGTGALIFDWWTHLLWALAWSFCVLWVPLFDAKSPTGLRAASVMIVAAAGCAVAGTWQSQHWLVHVGVLRSTTIVYGFPLALLAGWLLIASSINIGIAIKTSMPDAEAVCLREPRQHKGESEQKYQERRRVEDRKADAPPQTDISFVPTLLVLLVGGFAIGAQNPIVFVPLVWAILNLKGFPSVVYVANLFMCAGFACITIAKIYS